MPKYIVFIAFFFSFQVYGQLTIDAGNFGVVCSNQWSVTPTSIGGNPTVTSGSGKYSFTWEAYL